ncbi:MFS transporter [Notoacmeibacter sp. MSK16QG-6]|uniref:MFS transporter n=1 Tax=Notoacmeibacter sp. MSK16QG-6 TaxID=2957982 RepID=UPI00209F9B41|nr:MFS transporter [Notoacmeibacter sp. MSK16QG-6]MCP1198179.1 MFS transporter [Notoacmeibacter sp. MSK16QG-6]
MKRIETKRPRSVIADPRAVALLLAASLTTMANATISPALPGLAEEFSSNPNALYLTRLLVPAPSISVVLVAPLAGLVVDRIGRRPVLLFGVFLFVLAGVAGGILPSLNAIFVSRLALGVAVALIMTAQTALIGDYFAGRERSDLMGLQISARNFGGFAFISLAGLLAGFSSRLPFAIYGLAGIFLPVIWLSITEPKLALSDTSSRRLDTEDGMAHWKPVLAGLALLQMATSAIFFIMPTQLPFFFETSGFDGAGMTGIGLGALTLAGGCTALFYRRLQQEIGHAGAFASGYGAMAFGFAFLTFDGAPIIPFAGTTLIGIGFAMAMPNFVAIALGIVSPNRRGLAGSILTSSVFLGQIASPFLSTPVIETFGFDALFIGTATVLASASLAAILVLARYVGRLESDTG